MQAKKIKFNDAISETLFINLYFRALDNDEPDPILGDPFSRPVMQRIDYDFAKFKGGKFSKTGTVIRARFFDDEILDFAHKNAGEKLVVVQVGAGLDTRPLRLEKRLPDALFYDADFSFLSYNCDRLS
nr:class I SAM-dependent methyltransferase [uncultured Campylobacter sp.]